MQYAITTSNFGHCGEARVLVQIAQEAEAAGWDGYFLADHLQFPGTEPTADPWVALGAMAMRTERIRLGTMVTPIPRRRPWKLARETVTLDHLSGGRLILGVGTGQLEQEFGAFGDESDARNRAAMLEEGLEVLTGLWSGNPFSYQGSHYRAETPGFAPPAQTPRIPIWVAGTWPFKKPFQRAAHWDGVIPISSNWPAELTPGEIRDVAAYCKQHRTNDGCFDVACYGWTEGNDPREDAAIVASFEEAGATWWIEHRFSWEMPLDQLLERVRKGPPRA